MSTNALSRWRRRYISGPLLRRVRKLMPPISQTEREALEAGGLWWDAELLSGKPDWQRLLDSGPTRLSDTEQAFIDGPVEQLCAMIDDWQISFEKRAVPDEIWDFLAARGFFGMIIPPSYGGLGFSAQAHSEVVARVASRSIAVAVTLMVPNSLGPGELLLEYGTQAQKDHYLPRLADGREIPCFALTSPEAGSDAASMVDRGQVCEGDYLGEPVLGMRVNWRKRYITLGPRATLMGLAFKLEDPDRLLGDEPCPGITLALIPTDTPGVRIGRRHYPAMQAFLNGPNEGQDVFVPLDWVIGGRDGVGRGWVMLMSALSAGRSVSLPSLSVGAARLACRTTGAYARIREQFGLPVGRFEGVQEVLGRMAGELYLLDAARRATAQALDHGHNPAVCSAMLKVQATQRLREIIVDAMDVHGGKAICDGPHNYLGGIFRALPVAITVEGANILTRSLIVFGQGAVRCHPFLLKEIEAARNEDQEAALAGFDALLLDHLEFFCATYARALIHGLSYGRFAAAPKGAGELKPVYRQLSRYSAGLTWISEMCLLSLGGELKRREMLSARLGDILGELYLLSMLLKGFEDAGRPEQERPLLRYCLQQGYHCIEQHFDAVICNFPSRALAFLFRRVLFPFGRWQKPADDSLVIACAELLMTEGPARERLTGGIFHGNPDDGVDRVEQAFRQTLAVEPLRQRLRHAGVDSVSEALRQGLVSAAEAGQLEAADAAVALAIEVDAFDSL
ncbi:acyl-CoA dehydrogenase [Marinobacterium nitratireducens]|uniref:Acyl-coenzyme A dehydrogenase n=1 Tax=Marinobacterium nitratireducens TaxID=518897 RepID=A0A917Z6Y2_9GAMM|nr:acyl-CoA dehydrogenase [Marinobacterium nitratireducens]GGO76866.1 acyl-CoA dehydrogenase [Marinobacterium nitratireducens]